MEFYLGDEVIYNGVNPKIPRGTHGAVIGVRGPCISGCTVGVLFPELRGVLSNIEGDTSYASIWCAPNSLCLSELRHWELPDVDNLFF